MLDKRFYEGYEGEAEVKVWSDDNGIVIWNGFFNTILEGGFNSEFSPNGILECYFNQDGFYDDKWEMWSYVNILDTKSQTFLCCTSS